MRNAFGTLVSDLERSAAKATGRSRLVLGNTSS